MRHLHWSPTGRPRRRSIWLSLTLCLALSGGVAVVLPGRAHAATVIVSTCTESALDTAVAAANPGDTVQFGCSGTITLTKTLNITVNLTLEGRGQNVILDGNHSVQVLSVSNGINFTLDHLTVADGMSVGTQGGATAAGGGLFNYGGTITLTNCAFTGDTAQGANGANDAGGHAGGNGGDAFGGAVDIEIGTLTVTNCTITGNTARGGNGGNGGNNSPVGGNGRRWRPRWHRRGRRAHWCWYDYEQHGCRQHGAGRTGGRGRQ